MLLSSLKAGDAEATRELWKRYFQPILRIADRELGNFHQAEDGEDVALSVFDALFRGAPDGAFHSCADRRDLWALLICMTRQKSINRIRRETAQKRGNGKVVNVSALTNDLRCTIEELRTFEPSPEEQAILRSRYELLMDALKDDQLRRIAELRLEGNTTREIADLLKLAHRTIQRKLELIKRCWIRTARDEI